MIYVNQLSVSPRLLPLSFQLEKGEILHVIGPNGSGKSTLLSAVSGLLDCQGEIRIEDTLVSDCSLEMLATRRGYLPQQARPAFSLSVYHFLSLSVPATAPQEQVMEVLESVCHRLKVSDKLSRQVNQLSGGEWQRVRLAAICLQVWPSLNPYAELLLLDEPAAPLDIGQEKLLYDLIDEVASLGLSVIMANHDLNRTLHRADKALLLDRGVMKKFGDVESVLCPDLLSEVYETTVRKADLDGRPHLLF